MLLSHTFGMVSTNVMNLFGWHVVGVVKNLSEVWRYSWSEWDLGIRYGKNVSKQWWK